MRTPLSSRSKILVFRPLQRFILTQILQDYHEATSEPILPNAISELKTEHLFKTDQGKTPEEFTLGFFFQKTLRGKLKQATKLNHRWLYHHFFRLYRTNKNIELDITHKYSPLLFKYFDVLFTYEEAGAFLTGIRDQLTLDDGGVITDVKFDQQLNEFKKLDFYQNEVHYYRCYLGAEDNISKGYLTLRRIAEKKDKFKVSLVVQRNTKVSSADNNTIAFDGKLKEEGSTTYFEHWIVKDETERAYWILSTPNNSFRTLDFITGSYCATDKSTGIPVAGLLFLEQVTEAPFLFDDFFAENIPHPISSLFSGKKVTAPIHTVNQMTDFQDLVDRHLPSFAGLYHCYFLSMNGRWLRECIYEIDPTGKVRGKVSRIITEGGTEHKQIYTYRGKAKYEKGHFIINIEGKEEDHYEVFLNQQKRMVKGLYYGMYFGWDEQKRPRAGREVFVPYQGEQSFDELTPANHTQDSDHYFMLCNRYAFHKYFEGYKFSPIPKILNWIKPLDHIAGLSSSLPDFIVGQYLSLHLEPNRVEDNSPYRKQVSKECIQFTKEGKVHLYVEDKKRAIGWARLVLEKHLYVCIPFEMGYRFAIYRINAISRSAEVVIGLSLEINDVMESIVSSRQILIRKLPSASLVVEKLPLTDTLIKEYETIVPGIEKFLVGRTGNYIRLSRNAYDPQAKLSKKFNFGEVYFLAASQAARRKEDHTLINTLLEEAAHHGFDNIEKIQYEMEHGALASYIGNPRLPDSFRSKAPYGLNKGVSDPMFTLSDTLEGYQVPFRGRYNPTFISNIFEQYETAHEQLHIMGEVANISTQNTDLIDKLERTIRKVLDKNPIAKVYRYQTGSPVHSSWLNKLVALKAEYGERFQLFGRKVRIKENELSNLNIMLIDPYLPMNKTIIIITQDNENEDDVPVPVFAFIENNYRDLAQAMMKKIQKVKSTMKKLTNEEEIKDILST